jgi:hypothetical protein
VGWRPLAVLFQQAKVFSDEFRAREATTATPPLLAKAFRAAAGRYTQAALNFLREWQHKTMAAVVAKYEQLDDGDPKAMFGRLNLEHAAQTEGGAVSSTAESDWLEWRIAHAKLTLDNFAMQSPTPDERRGVAAFVSKAIAEVRANRDRWLAAELHPHPIMLAEMLADVMQAVVDAQRPRTGQNFYPMFRTPKKRYTTIQALPS